MGDRALVIFTDGNEVSPTVYLHWHGQQVPELLKEIAALMADRLDDVSYTAARFIGICHNSIKGNLSLGVLDTDAALREAILTSDAGAIAQHSHGNAGVVVVNVSAPAFSWAAYGGYLSKKKAD
jgi:hypothetical protein